MPHWRSSSPTTRRQGDKATSNTGSLMKDLADKSARDFTNELNPRTTISIWSPPASTLGKRPPTPTANHQTSLVQPALTAPAPSTPPSKVSRASAPRALLPTPVDASRLVIRATHERGVGVPSSPSLATATREAT